MQLSLLLTSVGAWMYDAKLSSRSVIHDSVGFAGRTMAENLENPDPRAFLNHLKRDTVFWGCGVFLFLERGS